jgi:hypothetical protein
MKNFIKIAVFTTFLFSSATFANESHMMMGDAHCSLIAKACKKAGFERKSEDKAFWMDCMKPILLGKTVENVTVDANDVKACRDKKIEEMQKELAELQAVK